jgi:D-alanine-D-alanine ligase
MKKTRVLVLAGGNSEEHEVSISSARSLLKALDGSPIDATALVVTRQGQWLTADESRRALTDGSAKTGGDLTLHRARIAEDYDVVFPLIHGPHGEDGTVQGMLELAGIPYVGSGVLASSLCMDKAMTKAVLKSHNIPQVRHTLVTRHQFGSNRDAVLRSCLELNAPWFVKPANLGSSVGISKATSRDELLKAIEVAHRYDRRALVEEGVTGARELEIGIMGNDSPEASPIGEITYNSDFYDYETKYTEGRADLHIPADVSKAVADRLTEMALKAYQALDCAGFARIDFFYQPRTGDLLLNELNTIPGFTPTSMFTKLWEKKGVSYPEVVQRLVELAFERHGRRT